MKTIITTLLLLSILTMYGQSASSEYQVTTASHDHQITQIIEDALSNVAFSYRGDTEEEFYIHVSPNPASDYVDIHIGDRAVRKIELYDVLGRVVETVSSSKGIHKIPLGHLFDGFYYIVLRDTFGRPLYSTKLVISE